MHDNLIQPFIFDEEIQKNGIPLVDDWVPKPEDEILKTIKGYIVVDIADFYNINAEPNDPLNYFVLKNKRSYNSPKLRDHLVHYVNYFEKYFDTDHELHMIYIRLKYLIDYEPMYSKDAFIMDLKRYILNSGIFYKVGCMNRHNYQLQLSYKNKKNPVLQYNDKHAMILMWISVLMNIMIPLLTHFMYVKGIENTTDFLLEVYDILLNMFDVDIYSKLYETSITNVTKNSKSHSVLWAAQAIRSNNVTTHSLNLGCLSGDI